MVFGRRGLGGPQVTEVQRMLTQSHQRSAGSVAWCNERLEYRIRGSAVTDGAFREVIAGGP